jgi:hypothetical protein
MESVTPWLAALWTAFAHWYPLALPLLIPFAVNLFAEWAWPERWRLWSAVALSVTSGVFAAVVTPVPKTPENLALLIVAFVVGTQGCYDLFRANGVTCSWLERLLRFGSDIPPR